MRRLSSAARRRHALGGECLRGEEEDEKGERNQERAASTGRAARSFRFTHLARRDFRRCG